MDPTVPGMPLNIMPPIQQQQMMQQPQPTGILNGQQNPQGNQQQLMQAMKLMQPQQQMQPMQPIPMAQPVGNMGIDPTKLLAAMQQNRLMNM